MSKEKRHMARVAELGCIICESPAEIHHCGTYMGGGRNDLRVIPLCPTHHRTGGYGVALHAGKRCWQDKFGYELELLDKTIEMLNANKY